MFSLSLRQAVSSFISSALREFDLLAKLAVPFPVMLLAPGRAVEDKVVPEATVHNGIQIALGACTQETGLQQQLVQFHSRQVQHQVKDGGDVICVRSGS